MFGFIKKGFFAGLTILSSVNFLTITPLRCISMTYPFSIKTSKCSGSSYQ